MEKPKFSFGDHVYFARVEYAPTYAPCVSCGGKGYVTILYEGETFTIDCEDCKHGYLGSNGCRGAYVYTPDVVEGIICGVERDSFEPYDFEYRMSINEATKWIMKERDSRVRAIAGQGRDRSDGVAPCAPQRSRPDRHSRRSRARCRPRSAGRPPGP